MIFLHEIIEECIRRRLFNTLDMYFSVSCIVFISALTYLIIFSLSPSQRILGKPNLVSIKDLRFNRLKQFDVSLKKTASLLCPFNFFFSSFTSPLLLGTFLVEFPYQIQDDKNSLTQSSTISLLHTLSVNREEISLNQSTKTC